MTSSVSGQDEPNLELWLATQAGPARVTDFVMQGKFIMFWCFIPYNNHITRSNQRLKARSRSLSKSSQHEIRIAFSLVERNKSVNKFTTGTRSHCSTALVDANLDLAVAKWHKIVLNGWLSPNYREVKWESYIDYQGEFEQAQSE